MECVQDTRWASGWMQEANRQRSPTGLTGDFLVSWGKCPDSVHLYLLAEPQLAGAISKVRACPLGWALEVVQHFLETVVCGSGTTPSQGPFGKLPSPTLPLCSGPLAARRWIVVHLAGKPPVLPRGCFLGVSAHSWGWMPVLCRKLSSGTRVIK